MTLMPLVHGKQVISHIDHMDSAKASDMLLDLLSIVYPSHLTVYRYKDYHMDSHTQQAIRRLYNESSLFRNGEGVEIRIVRDKGICLKMRYEDTHLAYHEVRVMRILNKVTTLFPMVYYGGFIETYLGTTYVIVMEFIDGKTLRNYLIENKHMDKANKDLLLELMYLLADLNTKVRFTHYDLHPSNLIITPTEPTVKQYTVGGEAIRVTSRHTIRFIDVEASYLEGETKGIASAWLSFFGIGIVPSVYDPFYDFSRLACSFLSSLSYTRPSMDKAEVVVRKNGFSWMSQDGVDILDEVSSVDFGTTSPFELAMPLGYPLGNDTDMLALGFTEKELEGARKIHSMKIDKMSKREYNYMDLINALKEDLMGI